MQYNGTNTTSEVRFSIRGFENAPVLIDGFRQYGFAEFIDPAGLERVEVLKGPASILYGEIQPGGVINAVTKRPLAEPFYEAEQQIGSRNLFRSRIDFSGPLTSDRNILYRLNALFSTQEGVQDFDEKYQTVFVAPVLTWNISDRTNLTVELQYQQRDKPFDLDDTVAFGRGVLDIPRDRVLGEPDDDSVRKILNLGYTLEHRFSDNWRIRNAFRYTDNSYFSDKLTIAASFDETTGILSRAYAIDDIDSQDYSLQTYLVGNFSTGPVKHTLLFGVDLNHSATRFFATSDFTNAFTTLDIFNPVYDSRPRPPLEELLLDTKVRTNRLGVYVQDQIAFFDNLKLLLGLRYETLRQEITTEVGIFTPTGNDIEQSPNALIPRVGIVYQPIQPISLYASYSQSFIPSDGAVDESGNILEPEKGEGFEVGIKADLIRDRLFATVAYFDAKPVTNQTPIALSQLLKKADTALPGGKISYVQVPEEKASKLVIRKHFSEQKTGHFDLSAVEIDRFTGKVLKAEKVLEPPPVFKVLLKIVDLHYGTFGGLPTRILYVFVGLAPLILSVTGFVMWWYRRRPKSFQQLAAEKLPNSLP